MTSSPPSLAERAEAVLRSNDRGRFTLPSPHLYPHQWAWDSAFAAIGWAHLDLDRAVVELETLMAGVWDDGRVPHIYFHDKDADYFPGPAMWETTDSTSISQPPVWASAARRVLELGGDRTRIQALLPAIDRSHQWFAAQRDPQGKGLVAVVHPWESGLDNSPAWDGPMEAVDASQAPPFKRVDLERVDDVGQRPGDTEYKRYVVLVKEIAKCGFGPGIFAVYDPVMTTLLAKAEQDLAWLATELGGLETEAASRAARLRQGLLDHLWDAEAGRFQFYDAVAERPVTHDVISCYLPLALDLPADVREPLLANLRAKFWTRYPLPSTAPSDPAFEARRYWRGPTWINTNWLLAPAVGDELIERSLELMEREGFREYYDAQTGEGLGAREFTWSAALALDWLRSRA
jgi:glycogen debranching enzyme